MGYSALDSLCSAGGQTDGGTDKYGWSNSKCHELKFVQIDLRSKSVYTM